MVWGFSRAVEPQAQSAPAQVLPSKDFLDVIIDYFENMGPGPRDFFKSLNQAFFWPKFFSGKDSSISKASLLTFPKVFDAFNILDLVNNSNKLRNYFLGKNVSDVTDLPLLVSDTTSSFCDVATWASVTTGIITLSSYTLSWIFSVGGATLAFSFAKYSIQVINDLRFKTMTSDEKHINMLKLAKDVALLAIGIIVFSIGWFALTLPSSILMSLTFVTIISEIGIHLIKNHKAFQTA